MSEGGLEWGDGLDESFRRRLETFSKKNEAKDSARDGLGIVDGSEVVYLWCSREFVFSRGDEG